MKSIYQIVFSDPPRWVNGRWHNCTREEYLKANPNCRRIRKTKMVDKFLKRYVIEVTRKEAKLKKGEISDQHTCAVDYDLAIWATSADEAQKIGQRRVDLTYPGSKTAVRGITLGTDD